MMSAPDRVIVDHAGNQAVSPGNPGGSSSGGDVVPVVEDTASLGSSMTQTAPQAAATPTSTSGRGNPAVHHSHNNNNSSSSSNSNSNSNSNNHNNTNVLIGNGNGNNHGRDNSRHAENPAAAASAAAAEATCMSSLYSSPWIVGSTGNSSAVYSTSNHSGAASSPPPTSSGPQHPPHPQPIPLPAHHHAHAHAHAHAYAHVHPHSHAQSHAPSHAHTHHHPHHQAATMPPQHVYNHPHHPHPQDPSPAASPSARRHAGASPPTHYRGAILGQVQPSPSRPRQSPTPTSTTLHPPSSHPPYHMGPGITASHSSPPLYHAPHPLMAVPPGAPINPASAAMVPLTQPHSIAVPPNSATTGHTAHSISLPTAAVAPAVSASGGAGAGGTGSMDGGESNTSASSIRAGSTQSTRTSPTPTTTTAATTAATMASGAGASASASANTDVTLTHANTSQQQHQPQQSLTEPSLESSVATLHPPSSLSSSAASAAAVEAVLAASCAAVGFDIAEMWLRTGPKTHQLTNSHLRPTALEDSVRNELIEVYYGERSSERTHRLSPALCKRAKEAMDVVWVTSHPSTANTTGSITSSSTTTTTGTTTATSPDDKNVSGDCNATVDQTFLRLSISDVRTAVAIPVCHEPSNTNMTVIFFSVRRIPMQLPAVEFLVHMALAAAVASVDTFALSDEEQRHHRNASLPDELTRGVSMPSTTTTKNPLATSTATPMTTNSTGAAASQGAALAPLSQSEHIPSSADSMMMGRPPRVTHRYSITGARLDLQWRQLRHVEYLTDGGNSWIHTAILDGKPVVVKTLKPECQDVAIALNEIESELAVHSRLNHAHIVSLMGAGITTKGVRFVVLERLDGGTLTQRLGYDNRIRDRRRRFWKRKQLPYLDVLQCARSVASALAYMHDEGIPGSMVLHRDLKPDNIGFTLNGTVKLLDFGLARIVENASTDSGEVFEMSGETGSLRYMAPEVADSLPYNQKIDVYSFGVILWELNSFRKPFEGLTRELFYERVVHGGERPPMNKKWPEELKSLMMQCWDPNHLNRPNFSEIVDRLDVLLSKEKNGGSKKSFRKLSGIIDRHSTWF